MRRRDLVLGAGSTIVMPGSAVAQQSAEIKRVGVLMGWAETDRAAERYFMSFPRRLDELGFGTGKAALEIRWSGGDAERRRAMARELVAMRPDVILAVNTPVVAALLKETRSIPIVFAVVSDPVGEGFVASIARPGGNVTGFVNYEGSLAGKWVELLKDIDPRVRRAAMLYNPATAAGGGAYYTGPYHEAGRLLGIETHLAPIGRAADVDAVIAANAGPGSGIVVMTDSSMFNWRPAILGAAMRHAVPGAYYSTPWVRDGGLISYGIHTPDLFRRAAEYVARILGGASPAELPVQFPTRFELAINLKTAKALGIEVAPMLLGRADEVIE